MTKLNKMKSYYVECIVSFTDNAEKKPWRSCAAYSFIVEAKNKKQGKADAAKRGIEEFENDLGKKMDDVKLGIAEFYETCEEARAN